MAGKDQPRIVYHTEARQALVRGIAQVAELVQLTLGPKGQNVVIEQKAGYPLITKDGATVAKHLNLPDLKENMGARLCKEVARQTDELVGDGTTTSIVLLQAMIQGGLRLIEAGINPARLKQGMDRAVRLVCAEITRQSYPATMERLEQIASTAAKDPVVGVIVAQAMGKTGPLGNITLRESIGRQTYLEFREGLDIKSGYLSPYFVDKDQPMMIRLENPYILATDQVIRDLEQIQRILNVCDWEKRPLLIVASQVTRDALGMLINRHTNGATKVIAIRTPGAGMERLGHLDDLSVVTGGEVIAAHTGLTLETMVKTMLGQATRVMISRDKTLVVGGAGNRAEILRQVKRLTVLQAQTSAGEQKEKLQERIDGLSGGAAVIQVGADTQMALREKKDRINDALKAARAAAESGVVPGGGTSLVQAAKVLDAIQLVSQDEEAGLRLVQQALAAPLRQIAENAGENSAKIVKKASQLEYGWGYDALTGRFTDLWQEGIVDPAKVVLTALTKAAGIASILLTTEALLEKEPMHYILEAPDFSTLI
ncbi:MAG: Hsp60 family chaperonin [Desulfitobacterium sp.]